jgi:hypothetical protein
MQEIDIFNSKSNQSLFKSMDVIYPHPRVYDNAFVFQILLIFQLHLQNHNLLFQFGYF